jgi:hypothetical protein
MFEHLYQNVIRTKIGEISFSVSVWSLFCPLGRTGALAESHLFRSRSSNVPRHFSIIAQNRVRLTQHQIAAERQRRSAPCGAGIGLDLDWEDFMRGAFGNLTRHRSHVDHSVTISLRERSQPGQAPCWNSLTICCVSELTENRAAPKRRAIDIVAETPQATS